MHAVPVAILIKNRSQRLSGIAVGAEQVAHIPFVRDVAVATAAHQQFEAAAPATLQHQLFRIARAGIPALCPRGRSGAHQTGRPRADDDHIVWICIIMRSPSGHGSLSFLHQYIGFPVSGQS